MFVRFHMTVLAALFATCAFARESVVFFSAHPDDTEGFAATAFLLKEKYDIYVADFTGGERGCGMVKFLSGWTMAKRLDEEKAALALLGAEPLYIGEVNGESCATPRAILRMTRLLKEIRPKAVFTHWPIDTHDDHRNCAIAVMKAVENLQSAPEFYFFEVLRCQTMNWHPLYSVDVTSTIEKKKELLRKYECQNAGDSLVKEKVSQAACRGGQRVPAVAFAETFTSLSGRRIEGGVLESLAETALVR